MLYERATLAVVVAVAAWALLPAGSITHWLVDDSRVIMDALRSVSGDVLQEVTHSFVELRLRSSLRAPTPVPVMHTRLMRT